MTTVAVDFEAAQDALEAVIADVASALDTEAHAVAYSNSDRNLLAQARLRASEALAIIRDQDVTALSARSL